MQIPHGLKKVAVICILKSGDQFLLLKRAKEPNQGLYTPVGGKLDPHEEPNAAAVRETFEETGIKVPAMQYCGTLIETSPVKYNWGSFIYLSEIAFVEAPYCNEGTLEWIDRAQLLDVPTPPTDWHIYQYVLEQKNFTFNAVYNENLELLTMTDLQTGEVVHPAGN
ncbi:MAG: NUDIX domain-containing protein [Bacteroidota bacterium]